MDGKSVVMLAADLAAGSISAHKIKEVYGDGILASVLAIGGGAVTGLAVNAALEYLDDETGIVSDIGSVIDDVFSIF